MTTARHRCAVLACWLVLLAESGTARAQKPALSQSIAVWRIDALGIDSEIVERLESLFRTELERLAGRALPSRRDLDRQLRRSRLRNCDGSTKCLAGIGKKLGVDLVVSGNVAALGDSYVINLKVIDVAEKKELRRIASDPLRGNPDELIEAVRVAAYRLVAPEQLHGAIAILTDLVGAKITLDGTAVGKTPLKAPLTGVGLGNHSLHVTAADYSPFEETVRVRFQKTTRVVVRLVKARKVPRGALDPTGPAHSTTPASSWYNSTWFYITVGVTAAVVGGYVGYQLAHDPVVDCSADPMACN